MSNRVWKSDIYNNQIQYYLLLYTLQTVLYLKVYMCSENCYNTYKIMAIFTYSNLMKIYNAIIENPRTYLIIITGMLILYQCFLRRDRFKKCGTPHETPSMLFGNMMQPKFGSVSFVERLRIHYRMDSISTYMGFYDFNNPVILIRSPILIKQITNQYFLNFANHYNSIDSIHDPIYSKHLFSLRDKKWFEARKCFVQFFTGYKNEVMYELILKCCNKFIENVVEDSTAKKFTMNSKDYFGRYVHDVMASYAFGIEVDSVKYPNNELYTTVIKVLKFKGLKLLKLFFIQSYSKLANFLRLNITSRRERDFFYSLIKNTVRRRKANDVSRSDMIQFMMNWSDNEDKKSQFSIEEMTSLSFSVFSNGFDSTISLICFATHLIAMHADVQEKLRNEVDEVWKQFNDKPTYKAINNMKYLDAVINETLRLYPLTPFIERVCTKSVELSPSITGGKSFFIKEGESVWIPIYGIQTDPTYFPAANEFQPERFFNHHRDIITSNTFIPFGFGPRRCVGNKFSILIVKVLLYNLIFKCYIKPNVKMSHPVKLSCWSFPMSPEMDFRLDLKSRWYETVNRNEMKTSKTK